MATADNGATSHYFHQAGANVIVNFQPTKMGTRVRLPDNRKMETEQVVHSPLAL